MKMASEARKIFIKPLNRSNYATWKVRYKKALIREGLWNILNETEGAPVVSNDSETKVQSCKLKKHK